MTLLWVKMVGFLFMKINKILLLSFVIFFNFFFKWTTYLQKPNIFRTIVNIWDYKIWGIRVTWIAYSKLSSWLDNLERPCSSGNTWKTSTQLKKTVSHFNYKLCLQGCSASLRTVSKQILVNWLRVSNGNIVTLLKGCSRVIPIAWCLRIL